MIEEIETIKKSDNPFKMWGSWIGLGISLFYGISFFIPFRIFKFFLSWLFYPLFFIMSGCSDAGCEIVFLVIGIISLFYGFLIGWGIHSLFRKMGWNNIHKKLWFWLVIILIISFILFYPAEVMQCKYGDTTPPRNIIQEILFHKCGRLDFGELCRNNSECLSKDCASWDPISGGKCAKPNFIQRLLD